MKKLLIFILVLFVTSSAFAQAVEKRRQNVATRICGTILDLTTARRVAVAVTNIVCEYSTNNDASSGLSFNSFTTPEVIIGTTGEFCQPITAAELNFANADMNVYCADTSIANSASFLKTITTRRDYVADGGIGPFAQAFDGQTLAEGVKTIDLEANEVSADGQFVGDRLALYHVSDAQYYASSCITASTNANERVTTRDDLSALHTVGDYYVLKADAGCMLALVAPQLSGPPTVGSETLIDKITAVYQRLVYKLNDDRNSNRRNWYNGAGSAVIGHQNLTNAGNINGTGPLVP